VKEKARESADTAKERLEEVKERVAGPSADADADGKGKHRRADADKYRSEDEL